MNTKYKEKKLLKITLSGDGAVFRSVSFDLEGLLVSESGDRTIQFWKTKTGECIRTLTGQRYGVDSVSFD
jgi:WD40 repeat protein